MPALDRVAQMLIDHERVNGEEFAAVYRGADAADVVGKLGPQPAVYEDEEEHTDDAVDDGAQNTAEDAAEGAEREDTPPSETEN